MAAGHDSPEALACGLPSALLHQSRGPATGPRRLHALLQHRAPAPRLSRSRSNPGRSGLGRGGAVMSFTTLGWRKCQHRSESGHTSVDTTIVTTINTGLQTY